MSAFEDAIEEYVNSGTFESYIRIYFTRSVSKEELDFTLRNRYDVSPPPDNRVKRFPMSLLYPISLEYIEGKSVPELVKKYPEVPKTTLQNYLRIAGILRSKAEAQSNAIALEKTVAPGNHNKDNRVGHDYEDIMNLINHNPRYSLTMKDVSKSLNLSIPTIRTKILTQPEFNRYSDHYRLWECMYLKDDNGLQGTEYDVYKLDLQMRGVREFNLPDYPDLMNYLESFPKNKTKTKTLVCYFFNSYSDTTRNWGLARITNYIAKVWNEDLDEILSEVNPKTSRRGNHNVVRAGVY